MALASFPIKDNELGEVLVEVDEPREASFRRTAGRTDGVLQAGKTLEDALASIKKISRAVAGTLAEIAPDEGVIEMGFKLTAESGFILTKLAGEAHLNVKLTWKRKDSQPG